MTGRLQVAFAALSALALGACLQELPAERFSAVPVATPMSEPAAAAATPGVLADVDAVCALVPRHYAYFDDVASDWEAACGKARTEAVALDTGARSFGVLETLIASLHDDHVSLSKHTSVSPRLVPSGSDYRLAVEGGRARIAGIRPDTPAAASALRLADEVVAINDRPVADILAASPDRPNAGAIALNREAAGRRGAPRSVIVAGEAGNIRIELGDPTPATQPRGPVSTRLVTGAIGYIRFNNSLSDETAIAAFDAALELLRGARAWIIDLRDTPGGGNTRIAEPILARFVAETAPYQLTVYPRRPAMAEQVGPRGPWTVKGAVIVLVGGWTGSMGEGMAIGLDGLGRATVIGAPMAGLRGGVESFDLPSGVSLRLPTYDLRHIDGTPRHLWRPSIAVPADTGNGRDDALLYAIALLTPD